MANQLPDGQIVPAAKPIDAFVQPLTQNIAQPNAAPRFGTPQGINIVQTAATPGVRGANNWAELADGLAPFSKQLTETLQTAGTMYAQAQAQEGERLARSESLRALAQNDAAMEASEMERAAINRRVGSEDPAAGNLMAGLNPYMRLGYERGKSKIAGLEAGYGLQAYVATRSGEIDYSAPDQGFGKLAQLQAEYTLQLAQKHGINATSPGFQKYTLPSIEKAQEKLQTKHLSDRKEYFDTAGVQQAAAQLQALYKNGGQVEYKGQVYLRGSDKVSEMAYLDARQLKAQEIVRQSILSSSMPGEASERSKKIYQQLTALADYKNDPELKAFIDSIPSNESHRGADGKPILNPNTGKPYVLSWGQMYQQESVDSEIKYGQAAYTKRQREKEEQIQGADGFDDGLLRALGKIPGGGPNQKAIADAYVDEWYQKNGRKNGISYADLQKRRDNLVELDAKRYAELTDPGAVSTFWTNLESDRGRFDAAAWRKKANEAAANIYDPKEKAAFIKQSNERIGSRETEQATFRAYDGIRDKVIGDNIKSKTAQFYTNPTDPNALESITRQRNAFTSQANNKLLEKEQKLGRKLFDNEVRATVQDAIEGYGRGGGASGASGQSQLDYLFPGSRRTDEPSVKGSGVNNYGKKPTTYRLDELGKIPDREAVLPNYRRNPVLSGEATVDLLKIATEGKKWPPAFERAWRDSRAKNAGEFLIFHADHYGIKLPPELRREINKKTSAAAGAGDAVVSQAATREATPLLAQIGNTALNVLTGATPAAAGTLDGAPSLRGGGGLFSATLESPYAALQRIRSQRSEQVALNSNGFAGGGGGSGGWTARDARGQSIVEMATRNGWDPSHIAAIFSYETGGTFNPSEPGRGAAAGRIGLIQAGPNERLDYGLGTGNWAQEIKGVERYLKGRGAKPGMGMADLYSTINGGNPKAGYTPDGNGVVPRNAKTLKALEQHRQQAMAKLGLQQGASYGLPVNAGLQQFTRAKPVTPALITSHFGNREAFRKHSHEGVDVAFPQNSKLGFKIGGTVISVNPTNSTSATANGGYGGFMDVRLDSGQIVRLAHLSQIASGLTKGSRFGANQIIARSGGQVGRPGSGRSTGDHLHLEEHSIRQGLAETTRGKLNPNRPGGALSYLIHE